MDWNFSKKKNRSNRVLIWFAATGIWWQKNIGSFVMYALGSGLVIIVREYTWGIGKFCGSFKSIVSTCMSQKYLWLKMSPELMSNMMNTTNNNYKKMINTN